MLVAEPVQYGTYAYWALTMAGHRNVRIVDGVSTGSTAGVGNGRAFDEFKPRYGTSLVTGWAEIHGRPIGILANAQGVLFSEEAQKATQFIQLANQVDTPLLFLHNTTGYMVGKEYEQGGIIKHGSMMINAVSNSTVPHISIMMGASYGAGNYGMCGRAYDPRFLFTWPSAKSAVMGPQQLAGVLSIVARAAAEAKGEVYDEEADAGLRKYVEDQVEAEVPAYAVAATVQMLEVTRTLEDLLTDSDSPTGLRLERQSTVRKN